MTFLELCNEINENDFKDFLISKNIKEKYIKKFIEIYNILKNTSPIKTKEVLDILIFKGRSFYDDEPELLIIEGIIPKKPLEKVPETYEELEQHIHRYSFSFTPWAECLNYTINEYSLNHFSKLEIFFAIIEEITECGFTEEEIQVVKKELDIAIEEIETGKASTVSIDDLEGFKEFKINRTEEEEALERKKIIEATKYNLQKYFEILK